MVAAGVLRTMSEDNRYLLNIARQIAKTYTAHPQAKAAMVTGSVAEGICDRYSDIDMSIYYDKLPSKEELEATRLQNQGSERIWTLGNTTEGAFGEAYYVSGIECQIGHTAIAIWEKDMAVVLEQYDVTSWVQKAITGITICIPLYGEEYIQKWKDKAANYPEALARATVEKYLQFFSIWGLPTDYFITRDATLFKYQVLVETVQNILGVLAGLNRLYYSTLQFKHMSTFIEKMDIVTKNLSNRIENLFHAELLTTATQLKEIVQELIHLVELHMPQIDTSQVRQQLDRRKKAWQNQEFRSSVVQ
jgi:predicted nucleotidyltransferase